MNLELIRKYEKEFLHMLHGGALMFKPNDKHVWFDSVTSPIDWTVEGLYIIDDIYCIYRIALAEGKTVQYKGLSTQTWCTIQPELGHTFGNMPISNYRIKPEEPKFKIGEWVLELRPDVDDYCYRKPSGRPFQIKEVVKGNTGWLYKKEKDNYSRELFEDNLSAWKPKEGEICIFWKEDSEYNRAVIGRLKQILPDGNYVMDYGSGFTVTYSKCIPFTGVLPPHMKDNK